MTPYERERLAERFKYRETVTFSNFSIHGYMLAAPVGFFVGALGALCRHRPVVAAALFLAAALVAFWVVSFYRRPVRPDSDDEFDRELLRRVETEGQPRS